MHINKTQEEKDESRTDSSKMYRQKKGLAPAGEFTVLKLPTSRFVVKMIEAEEIGFFRKIKLTNAISPPPCFDNAQQYRLWLQSSKAASGALPPHRHPDGYISEPNYCHDCTKCYQKKMIYEDRCIFPDTTFEVRTSDGEKYIAGVSHKVELDEEE